ncbi:hypothetical protein CH330_06475 [candidate division WOR-3 bacterium JGI_Cruoil_03_51_56]|uniref:4Fe-4S ferredoxin-type domain-containing protein n=1 Tax=candidate division WOR-3 bacterium JGI_Cruoil_03_51_56 TaxID=1973747 RepID=A0A235BRQ0_UNCW3|nr:MAG: hypothetical protein CH330_06475 [candidate division WOR-3 bacterium JGI_Cruoil_03_51_56]
MPAVPSAPARSAAPKERVLVRRVTNLNNAVTEALDFLEYDFTNKKVWVKPNLLAPHPPEASVTTDPELIRQVVRQLKSRAAKEIWVADNPGGKLHGDIETYIAPTGVVEASEGCFRNLTKPPEILKLNSRFISQVPVSHIMFEADVILDMPVFKTHALTLLTGAIKNLFGTIPGGQKMHIHTFAKNAVEFAELLIDIFRAIPTPIINIMDALRGMDGQNGPGGGRVLKIGKILAAHNSTAMDAVMALMAGIQPVQIPLLRIAAEHGLGPIQSDQIKIIGDFERIKGFRLPSRLLAGPAAGIVARIYPWFRRQPILKKNLCIRCQLCAKNCPVHAISMNPFPTINRKKCISCYCCAETCPTHAMVVPTHWRGLINNIISR